MNAQGFDMAWIKLRCREDEDTGCLIWSLGTNPAGAPVATKRMPDGKKPTLQMRRVVWENRHGRPVPKGKVVACSCKHAACLAHLELIDKAEVVRRQWTKAGPRAKLIAGVTAASRQRAKLDMDKARAIRQSNETLEVVAAQHGISVALASMVRRGERWKEFSNPFAGLL